MGPPFVFPFGPGQWALSSAGVEAADEVSLSVRWFRGSLRSHLNHRGHHSVGIRSFWPA